MSIDMQKVFSNLSSEDKAAAMQIKSPEDLVNFASARGLSITGDDAAAIFDGSANQNELTPEELENVTGGNTLNKYIFFLCDNNNFNSRCYSAYGLPCDHFRSELIGRSFIERDDYYLSCNKGCYTNSHGYFDTSANTFDIYKN